jgi:hypothetical protein
MWYLKCGVVPTKDNLARQNWSGSKLCVLCSHPECHFARFMWRAVQVIFNIDIRTSVAHLFSDWANGVENQFKEHVLVGVAALYWAMWTSRNDMVFDKALAKSYM